MALSLSHGKQLDVGHHGIAQDDLPPMERGALDPRHWFKPDDNPAQPNTPGDDSPGVNSPGDNTPGTPPASPRPIELEIGSGKGTFLVQHAQLYPDVDFLGIEWAKSFWRYAADRARRRGFDNIRLLRCDADMFIRHYVPDAVFRQVHIYFPDPWPKKRHHKRRLIQADFLRELHRVLVPAEADPVASAPGLAGGPSAHPTGQVGGQTTASPRIRIATDHADYFDWMREHAATVEDLFDRLPFQSPESAGEGEMVGTNFERKYRKEGRPFHGMILRKRP